MPPALRELVADPSAARAVWSNELGGLVFEIGADNEIGAKNEIGAHADETGTHAHRAFLKWSPYSSGVDLTNEAIRLRWAIAYTPVPRVLDHGRLPDGEWLLTSALPGQNAISPRWVADPSAAVTAIGFGLRAMHDALPVENCPFDWSAASRVERAKLSGSEPAHWDPIHQQLTKGEAFRLLEDTPPVDRLVVCHGDACSPNTLITDDGRWSGNVDLGALGVGDRWADLAVATWSTVWNYGPGWEATLLDAYGVAADPERSAYYRLLWDVSP
jgi:kanamycin kinase